MRKVTTEQFIEKAILVHGHRYDYTLSNYIKSSTKVNIICSIHGTFEQTPSNHVLLKQGCPKCAKEKRKTTMLERYGVEFPSLSPEIRAKQKQTCMLRHGFESPFGSSNIRSKIKDIIQEKYGTDNPAKSQIVKDKMKGTCKLRYGVEYTGQSPSKQCKTRETNLVRYGVDNPFGNHEIQEKIKQTNLQKYGVDNPFKCTQVQEKQHDTNIQRYGIANPFGNLEIQEKIKQTNLQKYGTVFVNQRHMTDVIDLLESVDWLTDQYILQRKTANRIATEIGVTDTTVGRYLKKFRVPISYDRGYSHKCISWLNGIELDQHVSIQHALNGGEYHIPKTRYKADGYCKEMNTVYEFHGDRFHGNPVVYDQVELCNPWSKLTAGELYQKTLDREEKIRALGYNLVTIWESEWDLLNK